MRTFHGTDAEQCLEFNQKMLSRLAKSTRCIVHLGKEVSVLSAKSQVMAALARRGESNAYETCTLISSKSGRRATHQPPE